MSFQDFPQLLLHVINLGLMLSYLQCMFGRYGSEETKLEQHLQDSL